MFHFQLIIVSAIIISVLTIEDNCPPHISFKGFSNKIALNQADCVWDRFNCKANEQCCNERFINCCKYIMDPEGYEKNFTTTEKPLQTTTTIPETTTKQYKHPDTLIGCIWTFNGCIQFRRSKEDECRSRFDECKMIVMGMMPPIDKQKKPLVDQSLDETVLDNKISSSQFILRPSIVDCFWEHVGCSQTNDNLDKCQKNLDECKMASMGMSNQVSNRQSNQLNSRLKFVQYEPVGIFNPIQQSDLNIKPMFLNTNGRMNPFYNQFHRPYYVRPYYHNNYPSSSLYYHNI